MDSSLAIVIGGTALFAYLVLRRGAGSRRAVLVAGGVTLGVVASFLLMPYLATVWLPAVVGLVAPLSGVVAYLVLRHVTTAGRSTRPSRPGRPQTVPDR
ncbi:hypothetical protein [Micromonospora sp. NPDC003241]